MKKKKGGGNRTTIEALKRALMLEMHGLRFYEIASQRTQSQAAKALFKDLAEDEKRHKQELERHFRGILKGEEISSPLERPSESLRFKDEVISKEIKAALKDAWFESGALAIGIMLEKKSIDYYKRRMESSKEPGEKGLFAWLLEWEKGHLRRLMALERSMREQIWHEARFWPME